MKESLYTFKINKDQNKIEINNGIQILRTILSYLVLQLHCYNIHYKNRIIIFFINSFHFYVPTFIIISYYFSYKIIKFKIIDKIKLRLKRLAIPYLLWPIIFFIINSIQYLINKNKINKYKLKDLYLQFLTGKPIYDVFWYLCNLILSFILFSIVGLLFNKYFVFIVQLIGILGAFYYPYHYYKNLFSNYIIEIKTLFHDFSKVVFHASIGISFASIISINRLRIYRRRTIIISLILMLLTKYFLLIINRFFFLRCIIIGIESLSIFILFSTLPFDQINNKIVNLIIKHFTKYTGGVYYLHLKIKEFLNKSDFIKNGTLMECLLIYIICYFICFIGNKAFRKIDLKYLFF